MNKISINIWQDEPYKLIGLEDYTGPIPLKGMDFDIENLQGVRLHGKVHSVKMEIVQRINIYSNTPNNEIYYTIKLK